MESRREKMGMRGGICDWCVGCSMLGVVGRLVDGRIIGRGFLVLRFEVCDWEEGE